MSCQLRVVVRLRVFVQLQKALQSYRQAARFPEEFVKNDMAVGFHLVAFVRLRCYLRKIFETLPLYLINSCHQLLL